MEHDIALAVSCGACKLQWYLMMRETQNKISHASTYSSSDVIVGMGCNILRYSLCAVSVYVQKYAKNVLFYVIRH